MCLIMNNERKIKDLYHIVDELVHIRDTINFPKQSLLNRFNASLEDIQKHHCDTQIQRYLDQCRLSSQLPESLETDPLESPRIRGHFCRAF